MNILEIKKLKKSYKDFTAVKGLDLTISAGEIHGILGPNGAGKSTLMNSVLGLLHIDEGEVLFEEKYKIKKWSQNIGYVPQELAIYPELTPQENIRFFASLYGLKGDELKGAVEEALDFVGLAEVKDKKAKEFSGGMKRRLNLACAIVHKPRLIIMDEPTVGIDPQSRNRILENVRALNKNGASVIYTTHYMQEVEEICNKITVIDHGEVIASGTKEEILHLMGQDEILTLTFRKGDKEAFIRELESMKGVTRVDSTEEGCKIFYDKVQLPIGRIIAETNKTGLEIENIVNEEPKLEEIFLSLTGKKLRD